MFPTAWVRAALDLAILSTLTVEPRHGYAVASRLEEEGMGRLKGGSLYPALARLEEAGWIEASWAPGPSGPGRKEYALTPAGRRHREEEAQRWGAFTGVLLGLATTTDSSEDTDGTGATGAGGRHREPVRRTKEGT